MQQKSVAGRHQENYSARQPSPSVVYSGKTRPLQILQCRRDILKQQVTRWDNHDHYLSLFVKYTTNYLPVYNNTVMILNILYDETYCICMSSRYLATFPYSMWPGTGVWGVAY